ncbi:hypothetical protein ACC738_35165, partial [Rhizobium ruizarguesonis]
GEGSHGSILNGNYAPNRLSSAWKPTKGLLRKLGDAAGEGAVATVKKGAEMGLGFVLKRLWEQLAQFLGGL